LFSQKSTVSTRSVSEQLRPQEIHVPPGIITSRLPFRPGRTGPDTVPLPKRLSAVTKPWLTRP
jgi:hypothetical protein